MLELRTLVSMNSSQFRISEPRLAHIGYTSTRLTAWGTRKYHSNFLPEESKATRNGWPQQEEDGELRRIRHSPEQVTSFVPPRVQCQDVG